jgi:hypothetical protein
MIEQDPVARVDAIGFAIIYDPVGAKLGDGVR